MSLPVNPPTVTTYLLKAPLRALAGKPLMDIVIPVGSMVEWQPGDYSGGMASVFWLRRRILVIEAELFTHCERLVDGRGTSREAAASHPV
jgi:hypothetical protein